MKLIKLISISALMIMLVFGLTGCMGLASQDLSGHALVGVWNWDDNTLWQYIFNDDGTGERGLPDSLQSFNWSDQGDGHIRINAILFLNEEWNYSINDNILTLDSRQTAGLTYHYRRDGTVMPIDPALVGEWTWDDNWLHTFVFYEDATGRRGLPDWIEEFEWTMLEDGHLRLDILGGFRENWNYTITGDTLTTISRDFAGISFNYTRAGAELVVSEALFGEWYWDENELYEYIFYADGTGWRGLPDWIEEFIWTIPNDGHLRLFMSDGIREDWNYSVYEDVLTLESRQMANVRFSYLRAVERY